MKLKFWSKTMTTKKYLFQKVRNNHNRLRDDEILMDTCSEIKKGQPVILYGPPKEGGQIRFVSTSPVKFYEVDCLNNRCRRWTVHTESRSIYTIEEKIT